MEAVKGATKGHKEKGDKKLKGPRAKHTIDHVKIMITIRRYAVANLSILVDGVEGVSDEIAGDGVVTGKSECCGKGRGSIGGG